MLFLMFEAMISLGQKKSKDRFLLKDKAQAYFNRTQAKHCKLPALSGDCLRQAFGYPSTA